MAANYAESDEDVDIEGIADQDDWTSFRNSSLQDDRNTLPEKGFSASTMIPSSSSTLFSTDCCDANLWLDSMWSLDHCEDEKSRTAIEKMILEEDNNKRLLMESEVCMENYRTEVLTVRTKQVNIRKNSSTPTKQKSKVKRASVHQSSVSLKWLVHHTLPCFKKLWTVEEQNLFEEGLRIYGRSWTRIAAMIDGRTTLQVKNFASRYFKMKCLSTPSKGDQERCTSNKFPLDDSNNKEHTEAHLNSSIVCCVENPKDADEDDCDVDIDVDGDAEDTSSNPLMPGQTVAPDEIYSKLIQSALQEKKEDQESSDDSCSDEEVRCEQPDTKSCSDHKPLENPETEQDSTLLNPVVEDPSYEAEGDKESSNTKRESSRASCSNVTCPDCSFSSKKNDEENIKTIEECDSEPSASLSSLESCGEEKNNIVETKPASVQLQKESAASLNKISLQDDQTPGPTNDGNLELVQSPATKIEVTAAAVLPTNERFQPVSDTVDDMAESISIQRDTILEEEKVANSEFFMGRSLKTPERYMKIRNYILDMWEQTKPHYLFKTSVRSGLKSCGDVNSIGRVHAFLEDINAINVDCPAMPQPRLARVRSDSESDKKKDAPMESWVSVLRPRKRRINTVKGEWIDENAAEGVTITHPSEDEDEVEKESEPERPPLRRSRRPRPRPLSYDPFQLIPCRKFPSASSVPFEVYFSSCAMVVMDTHAHMSTTEVIGLLGGKYYPQSRKLEVHEASPCDSLSTGMQCEMDPVSQTEASEDLARRGLSVVGWYHSHPTFAASPSIRDIETQAKFQEWFGKGGAPFVGVIVSPYNYTNSSNQSQLTCLTISDDWNTTSQYRLPYQFKYTLISNSSDCTKALQQLQELAETYCRKKSRIRMTLQYSRISGSGVKVIDKLLKSIGPRLSGDENSNRDFVEKLREVLLSVEPDCSVTCENELILKNMEPFAECDERDEGVSFDEKTSIDGTLETQSSASTIQNISEEQPLENVLSLEDSKQQLKKESSQVWEGQQPLLMNCLLLGAEEEVVTTSDFPLDT